MKNFHFRLDSVLRLRAQQVEAEQMKLQQLLAERARLTKYLELAAQERAEAAQYVQHLGAGTRDLRALASYIIGSQMQIARVRSSLRDLEQVISEQKARLIRAEQNEKLLATLREKRAHEWAQALNNQTETEAHECWIASWNKEN